MLRAIKGFMPRDSIPSSFEEIFHA